MDKQTILKELTAFERELRSLRSDVKRLTTQKIHRQDLRDRAEDLATRWVEDLRSPLEHRFGLSPDVIAEMANHMKHLHVLSRPGNRKVTWENRLDEVLKSYKNRFMLPIQQMPEPQESTYSLSRVVTALSDVEESDYLEEAVACADAGFTRAAVVMGWCAVVDRIQRRVQQAGFEAFNQASEELKRQTSGKFKRYNKSFNVTTLSELQAVFDTDLIMVLEGMELLDGNQATRLRRRFEERNQSAHPGDAPIGEVHVEAFFIDIVEIVLTNPKFELR